MPDLITPIVHRNGDTRETLTAQLSTAYRAVSAALEALQHGAPNPRNYYVVDGLFPQALAQHQARLNALIEVQQSLLAEYRTLDEEA